MNTKERAYMVLHVKHLIKMYMQAEEYAHGDQWTNLQLKQAHRDALESLKHAYFIVDYDLRGYVTFPGGEILDFTVNPAIPISAIPR
jgi:hypothetical protein